MTPSINTSSTLSSTEVYSAPLDACVEASSSTPLDLIPAMKPSASDLDAAKVGGRSPSPTIAPDKRTKKATSKAAPKPALAAPSVGTRSSARIRKAPQRFINLLPSPKAKALPARKMAGSKVYEPVFVTTNANSRLKKTDVFHMLLEPRAWTCLVPEQKLDILALLPSNLINDRLAENLRSGTAVDDARPREFNINFNLFRTDVAKFKEDLENGHLGKTWQAEAEQAMVDRTEGKFDSWKERKSQLWWGQN